MWRLQPKEERLSVAGKSRFVTSQHASLNLRVRDVDFLAYERFISRDAAVCIHPCMQAAGR